MLSSRSEILAETKSKIASSYLANCAIANRYLASCTRRSCHLANCAIGNFVWQTAWQCTAMFQIARWKVAIFQFAQWKTPGKLLSCKLHDLENCTVGSSYLKFCDSTIQSLRDWILLSWKLHNTYCCLLNCTIQSCYRGIRGIEN